MQYWGQHVVIIGNPFDDGLRVVGPFKDGLAAATWADEYHPGENWWAVPLEAQHNPHRAEEVA